MISKIDLHLRANPLDEHRSLGVVTIEHDGPRLAPYQEVTFHNAGRQVTAHITAIRQRPDRLPHVYADEIRADAIRADAILTDEPVH